MRPASALGQKSLDLVRDEEFRELRRWFDDEQVVEIVGVISLFGFLNRWNALLATDLESSPLSFARRALIPAGWQPGAHAGEGA